LSRFIEDDPQDGPDMGPMIDIVFNLLIFFMCATKFKTAEGAIESYLPKNQGLATTSQPQDIDEVRVTVSWREGRATVRLGANLLSQEGDWDVADPSLSPVWGRLAAGLRDLKKSDTGVEPFPVTLDIRPDVPHQYAVSALNEVIRVEIKEVRFAAPELPY
jgi:biopolymer transport protein ExbD